MFLLHIVAIFVLREPSLRHYEELHIFLCVFREPYYGSVNGTCFSPFPHFTFSFRYLLFFSLVTVVLENTTYAGDVQTSMILLLCLLNTFLVLSKFNRLFIKATQRSALLQCQAVCEDISMPLEECAPSVLWNSTPEQVQVPEKRSNCLQQMCHHSGNCRETPISATCRGLAYAYCCQINTTQHTEDKGGERLYL